MPAGVTSRRPPLKGNSAESIRFRARLSENIRRLSAAKGLVREELSRLALQPVKQDPPRTGAWMTPAWEDVS